MVAIVTGAGLGLVNTSLGVLGGAGGIGSAGQGQLGESLFVNGATGNLVVSHQDDILTGRGLDIGLSRTYNSNGAWDGDNNDSWRIGVYRRLTTLTGTLNSSGSSIQKTEADGSVTLFTWDQTRIAYVSKSGSGAFDTLTWNGSLWTFTDGNTKSSEIYDWANGSGKLIREVDIDGNALNYAYTNGLITQIESASAYGSTVEKIRLDYTGSVLASITTSISDDGVTTRTSTRVYYEYDANNRLSKVITDLSPDDNSKTDGNVYTVSYTYYTSGDAGYTPASLGKLRTLTQSDGSMLTLTYDTSGRVISVKDALNRLTRFDYGVANEVTVTDALNQRTTLRYDSTANKNLTHVINAQSETLVYAYTPNGDLLSITDARGQSITYEYDSNGNRTLERAIQGNTVSYTYGAANQLTSMTRYIEPDPDGAGSAAPGGAMVTRYVYDAKKHLRFEISPEGRVVQHIYNSVGQREATVSYHGNLYTAAGSPTEADLASTWLATVDKTKSVRTGYTYDFRGNLKTTTTFGAVDASGEGIANHAATRTVTTTYSASGQLLQTIDPRKKLNGAPIVTAYTYDGMGRLTDTVNTLDERTTTTFDDAGRKITVTYANNRRLISLYDTTGQITSVMESDAALSNLGTTRYYYDGLGRERLRVDATGQHSYTLYDSAGRKSAEIDHAGRLTRYTYTAAGQLYQVYRFANPVAASAFAPGGAGSLLAADGTPNDLLLGPAALAAILPATDTESIVDGEQDDWTHMFYDKVGRLSKTVDRANNVTWMGYDGANRVVRTVRAATPTATTGFTSEMFASAVVVTDNAALDRTTRTFYDNDGLKRGELDAEGYLTQYRYDAQGRSIHTTRYAQPTAEAQRANGALADLIPAADAINDQHSYVYYTSRGDVAATVDAEGYLSTHSYDLSGNLLSKTRYETPVAASVSSVLSTLIAAAGDSTSQTYGYDDLGRLYQETDVNGAITVYVYNKSGQVESKTITVGPVGATESRVTAYTYELDGQLKTTTQAQGGVTTATYDAAGRLIKTVQQLTATVNATTLHYYARGFETNGDNARQYNYVIDGEGYVNRTALNALGQVTETRRSAAKLSASNLTLLRNEGGGFVSNTLTTALSGLFNDTLDQRTRTTYTVNGLVEAIQDAFNNRNVFVYNAFGEVTQSTQDLGDFTGRTLITVKDYDRRGLLKNTFDNVSGTNKLTASFGYDAFGRAISTTDAKNIVRTMAYDRLGRVLRLNGTLGTGQAMTYDAWGRVLTLTDALQRTTTSVYDDAARTLTVTSPEGVVTVTKKTQFGQTLSVTVTENGNDKTTTYYYDKNGNLKKTVLPDNVTHTDIDYDLANRVIARYDASTSAFKGTVTVYAYDAINRVVSTTVDPGGQTIITTTSYGSTATEQYATHTDANGVVIRTSYDAGGRAIRITTAPGTVDETVTAISYDAAGHQLTVIEGADSNGAAIAGLNGSKTTSYSYDRAGRRTGETIVDARNVAGTGTTNLYTGYLYDANGNVFSKVGANGFTRYVYDSENRLVYTINPLGMVSENTYDANGRVIKTRQYANLIALNSLPSFTSELTLADVSSRLTVDAARDTVTEQGYDRDGRLVASMDSKRYLTRFEYNASGLVVRTTRYRIPVSASVTFNATTTVSSADDPVTRHVYDSFNRLAYSIDALNYVSRMDYDASGRLIASTRYESNTGTPTGLPTLAAMAAWAAGKSGRTEYRAYDKAGRIKYTVDAGKYVTETVYYSGQNLVKSTTRYDQATTATAFDVNSITSNMAGRKNATKDQTTNYVYDGAGRLKQETDALGRVESYTYTRLGLKKTLTNKLGLTWNYYYDNAGRLIKETTPPVTVASYTTSFIANATSGASGIDTVYRYDGAGNLRYRVEAANISGQSRTTEYQYDALNRQTATILPTVQIDGNTQNLDADVFGNLTLNRTTAGFATSSTPTTQVQYDAFGNAVVNRDVMGVYSYKAYDNLNRVRYEIDGEGYVTEHDYDAYGNEKLLTRYSQRFVVTLAGAPLSEATLNATYDTLADPNKRTLTKQYDNNQRLEYVYEDSLYHVDGNAATGTVSGSNFAKLNQTTYNAFDEVIKQTVKLSANNNADTYSYYDARGNKTAQVDAEGYLTTYDYDAFGNVKSQTEYAQKLAPGWTTTSYGTPTANDLDRRVDSVYDRMNRKTSDTRIATEYASATGLTATNLTGNLTTSYRYDHLGNQIAVVDAMGSVTRHYYDALGRQRASVAPTRQGISGTVTPLVEHDFDAFGNIVRTYRYSGSATSVTDSAYTAPAKVASADRQTIRVYDTASREIMIQQVDGSGANKHIVTHKAYDAAGRVTKEWTGNTDALGNANNSVRGFTYDKVGRQTATLTRTKTRSVDSYAKDMRMVDIKFGYEVDRELGLGLDYDFNLSFNKLSDWGLSTYRVLINYTVDGVADSIDHELKASQTWHNVDLKISGTRTLTLTDITLKGYRDGKEYELISSSVPLTNNGYYNVSTGSKRMMWAKSLNQTQPPEFRYRAVGTASWITTTPQTIADNWYVDVNALAAGEYEYEVLYKSGSEVYGRSAGKFNTSTVSATVDESSGGTAQSTTSHQMGVAQERALYNAFGEITDKAMFADGTAKTDAQVVSAAHVHYDYDQNGRIWRNRDNGVWTVTYYNTLGVAAVQIKSANMALGSISSNLSSFASTIGLSSPSSLNSNYRRTYSWANKLGQVVRQQTPTYQASTPEVIDAAKAYPGDNMYAGGTGRTEITSTSGSGGTNQITNYTDGVLLSWDPVRPAFDMNAELDKVKLVYTYKHNGGAEQTATVLDLPASQTSHRQVFGTYGVPSQYSVPSSAYTVTGVKVYVKLAGAADYLPTPIRDSTAPRRRLSFARPPGTDRAIFRYRTGPNASWSQLFVDFNNDNTRLLVELTERTGLVAGTTYEYQLLCYGDNVTPPDLNSPNAVLRARSSTSGTFTAGPTGTGSASGAPVTAIISPVSTQQLDRWGNITQTTNALGEVSSQVYNDNNQLIESHSAQTLVLSASGASTQENLVTRTYFDALGRRIGQRDAESKRANLGLQQAWTYDAAGDLLSEETVGSAGGRNLHYYNAFGDKVRSTDPLYAQNANRVTNFSYDSFGRMVQQKRGSGLTESHVYDALGRRIETHNWLAATTTGTGTEALTLQQDYDAFGRVIRSSHHHYINFTLTQSYASRTRYDYVALGNTYEITILGSGVENNTEYDLFGRKVRSLNGAGDALTWHYNTDGQLLSHKDLAGVTTSYTYYNDGKLKTQTNDRSSVEGLTSQSLSFDYNEAGQQTLITDNQVAGQNQKFSYDALGRKVMSVFSNGSAKTVEQTEYDALGRLSNVIAGDGSSVNYAYDANGNRRRTRVNYRKPLSNNQYYGREYWYTYDRADRMTLGQGVLKNGVISVVGKQTETTYDLGGSAYGGVQYNTASLESINTPQGVEISYDAAGQRKTSYSLTVDDKWQYDSYTYDDNGRLLNIYRDIDTDNVRDSATAIVLNQRLLSSRLYDQANRITRQDDYKTDGSGNRIDYRTNIFDGAGHIVRQHVRYDNGDDKAFMKWTYDAAGNVRKYRLDNRAGNDFVNTYTYDYRKFDTYRESRVTGRSDYFQDGQTDETYDHNGNLIKVDDATDDDRDRTMSYDLTGHVIRKTSSNKTQLYLYAEGAERASYGNLDNIDVDEGYTPIANTSIGSTPGSYTVVGDESLQNIAISVWGDGSLWYLIAEANGLNTGSSLSAGQTLVIPNRITNTRNSAEVFKPYNPSAIIGDTTPNLPNPPPPSEGGCGALGMFVMVVVACVIAAYLGPIAAAFLEGAMGAMAAGVAGAAIGAAAGSVGSQLVGLATGNITEFSWKQVGQSALTAALTAGIGEIAGAGDMAGALNVTNKYAAAAINAATQNAIGQGLMISTGLQEKFDWRSVAVSAIGASASKATGNMLGVPGKTDYTKQILTNLVNGTINRAVSIAVYREGKMEWGRIAADAFGNVLSNALNDRFGFSDKEDPNFVANRAVGFGVKTVTNYLANRLDGKDNAWKAGVGQALAEEGTALVGDFAAYGSARGVSSVMDEGGLFNVLANGSVSALAARLKGGDAAAGFIGGASTAFAGNFVEGALQKGGGLYSDHAEQITERILRQLGMGLTESAGLTDLDSAAEAAGNVYRFNQNGDHSLAKKQGDIDKYTYKFGIRSFHPKPDFGWTGLWFHGDNRGFSLSDDSTSRIKQEFEFNAETGEVTRHEVKSDPSSMSWFFGLWENEETYESLDTMPRGNAISLDPLRNDNVTASYIDADYAGKNFAFPTFNCIDRLVIPDLDVHSDFYVNLNKKSGTLDVFSLITGDGFPNAEAFIDDTKGNRAFLGTHVRQGDATRSLFMDGNEPMMTSSVQITLKQDGSFDKIRNSGSDTYYSIEEWNKPWLEKDPNEGRMFNRN